MKSKIKMLLDMQRMQYADSIDEQGDAQLIVTPKSGNHFVFVFEDKSLTAYIFDGATKELLSTERLNQNEWATIESLCEMGKNGMLMQLDGTIVTVWMRKPEEHYVELSLAERAVVKELGRLFQKIGSRPPWITK